MIVPKEILREEREGKRIYYRKQMENVLCVYYTGLLMYYAFTIWTPLRKNLDLKLKHGVIGQKKKY
jgi:hypothetical protein